jgi:hypothetical protein
MKWYKHKSKSDFGEKPPIELKSFLSTILLMLSMNLSSRSHTANAISDLIYPRTSYPMGRTWEYWTQEWWRWFLSFSKKDNPAFDSSGKIFQELDNHPDIWFLAGTIGGIAERDYHLNSQKPVLCPIFNYIVSFADEPEAESVGDLSSKVRKDIDNIALPFVSINNYQLESVELYRVQTPYFDLQLPEDNLILDKKCNTGAVADGYWLFLKPLPSGNYDIHCNGSCSSGKTTVDITWHLTIN